jgi:hypothetical protein
VERRDPGKYISYNLFSRVAFLIACAGSFTAGFTFFPDNYPLVAETFFSKRPVKTYPQHKIKNRGTTFDT